MPLAVDRSFELPKVIHVLPILQPIQFDENDKADLNVVLRVLALQLHQRHWQPLEQSQRSWVI